MGEVIFLPRRRWIGLREVVQILVEQHLWFVDDEARCEEVQEDDPEMMIVCNTFPPKKESKQPSDFDKRLRSLRLQILAAAYGDGRLHLNAFLSGAIVKPRKRNNRWVIASDELEKAIAQEKAAREARDDGSNRR